MTIERDFETPEEYVDDILEAFTDSGVDDQLITYMEPYLLKLTYDAWRDYAIGDRASKLLTVEELESAHTAAIKDIARSTVDDMTEKGWLQTVVGDDGELAYMLTEEGKQIADMLNGNTDGELN
jgi:hypothetical protein